MKYAGLVVLLALPFAAGCATSAPVRHEPKTVSSVRLPSAELPRLLIEDIGNQAGRGDMQGPTGVFTGDPGVAWEEVVREALPRELTSLGWPLALSRGLAGARLKATIAKASAKWGGGFGVRVTGELRILLTLKEPSGREVWEGELVGAGAGKAAAGGIPAGGIRQAWAAALADAMSRLGPLLESERPWLLLGKTPAAAPAVAAPARSELAEHPAAAPDPWHWKAIARAPRAMSTKAVVALDGVLYLISGSDRRGPSTAVELFDMASRSWSAGRPLPAAIACTDAVALDGKIYTAGGCVNADPMAPTAAAYSFDPAAQSWSELPPLPSPVYDATAAAVNGRLVVFGGVVNQGVSRRVHAFDPKSGVWIRLADLPAARSHAAGGMLGKKFMLTGGCTGGPSPCSKVTDETFVYDPADDSWSRGPALPQPMHTHGAVVDGVGRLLVAGGDSDMSRPMQRWTFTLEEGAPGWKRGPDLVLGRWGPRLFRMGGGIGLFGSTKGNYPESLIEALGVPGPELDSSAPVVRKTKRAEALPPAGAPRPRAHAVVIGIERYRGALPRADFAASDARLTAKYFERVLGVPAENTAVLTDDQATKGDFEKYFERWLPNRVEPGDEVFVYFSGHGAPDPKSGESYLVPYDADPIYLEQTGYPIARLYSRLAKLRAKRVVVAMDSCFSGAGGRSVIAKGARPLITVISTTVPAPLVVISAAAGDQISNTYQEKEHGLFTYYFLEGLAASGGDLRASFDYLKPKVTRAARRDYNSDQDPQWREGK